MGAWGHNLKLPITWFAVWEQAMHSSWIQEYLIAGSSTQIGMSCSGRQWQVSTHFFSSTGSSDCVATSCFSTETAMPLIPVRDLMAQNADQCTNSDFEGKSISLPFCLTEPSQYASQWCQPFQHRKFEEVMNFQGCFFLHLKICDWSAWKCFASQASKLIIALTGLQTWTFLALSLYH